MTSLRLSPTAPMSHVGHLNNNLVSAGAFGQLGIFITTALDANLRSSHNLNVSSKNGFIGWISKGAGGITMRRLSSPCHKRQIKHNKDLSHTNSYLLGNNLPPVSQFQNCCKIPSHFKASRVGSSHDDGELNSKATTRNHFLLLIHGHEQIAQK